ncbi:MAG: TonB-dependent receptor, partial [Bacteroidota bacterium]
MKNLTFPYPSHRFHLASLNFPSRVDFMRSLALLQYLVLFTFSLCAQQVLKGVIMDKESELPLVGATVQLTTTEPVLGAVSDVFGHFAIEGVPLGRHRIRVSYIGYQTLQVPNVEVTAGKEVVVEFGLIESVEELEEVEIFSTVQKDGTQNELASVSSRMFSMEEVNRFSGGRSDVARLAANFAGVSAPDDARNDIVIRGNSPTGVLWRLQGIPIPNPNHFATVGTTGGPVSALNPNMLKNSDFLTSAFPAEYGNALAGVFDLGFREGNKDKHEFMLQMGIVSGFEGMAEGPINQSNHSSYLVAGRYAFVGVASDLGLPIGTNAAPDYQDFAFNINFGNSPLGKFSLFGIGGRSDIDFLHNEIDEEDLFSAEDEDLFFVSNFGVLGLKHQLILGNSAYVQTTIATSANSVEFEYDRLFFQSNEADSVRRIEETDNREGRWSFSSFYHKKFNARLTTRMGLLLESYSYDLSSRSREFTPDWRPTLAFNERMNLVQGYIQAKYKLSTRIILNAGLHTQLLTLNNNGVIEPRLALTYALNSQHKLSLGYGLHSQIIPLPILLAKKEVTPGVFEEANLNLKATRNQHFVLGYQAKLGTQWRVKLETYYQFLDRVPVDSFSSSFSLLNEGADFDFSENKVNLVNAGTGINYGVELTVEKFFSRGYYALLTGSVYNSTYEGSDGIARNTAFNNQYVVNVLTGKEFPLGSAGRNILTFDTKLTTSGGRNYTPINLEASQDAGRQILFEGLAFSERFDPYFRWDVKVGMKFNSRRKNLSQHVYLDIQNVTDNQNVFTRRYNRLTNA